jgi:hypothetical protein
MSRSAFAAHFFLAVVFSLFFSAGFTAILGAAWPRAGLWFLSRSSLQ